MIKWIVLLCLLFNMADFMYARPASSRNYGVRSSVYRDAPAYKTRLITDEELREIEDDIHDFALDFQIRASVEEIEKQVFELTNEARQQGRYCGNTWFPAASKLDWNDQLGAAARQHANDMLANNYFSHASTDGRTPWDRMAAAGYPSNCAAAENIAGNSDPPSVVASWLKSPGHCSNIMNESLKVLGVGYAEGGPYGAYWVQNFGRC